MLFEPLCSFSISHFAYDPARRELTAYYFDARRKVCMDVPPDYAAALRDATDPEAIMRRFATTDVAG